MKSLPGDRVVALLLESLAQLLRLRSNILLVYFDVSRTPSSKLVDMPRLAAYASPHVMTTQQKELNARRSQISIRAGDRHELARRRLAFLLCRWCRRPPQAELATTLVVGGSFEKVAD